MTCGGLNAIGFATELGGTSLLITENAKYALSDNIEAPRMIQEEGVEKLGFTPTMSIETAGVRFTWPAILAKE